VGAVFGLPQRVAAARLGLIDKEVKADQKELDKELKKAEKEAK
jgi:hypothetical protein